MSGAGLWASSPSVQVSGRWPHARLTSALWSATPALLFGLRLWAAVCLALYVAFWLQLDNAYWAGTSAAIVCQPSLGASLRKGWFRMVGTAIGAVAIVVLTAMLNHHRRSRRAAPRCRPALRAPALRGCANRPSRPRLPARRR
jgi:hypothetical protein